MTDVHILRADVVFRAWKSSRCRLCTMKTTFYAFYNAVFDSKFFIFLVLNEKFD